MARHAQILLDKFDRSDRDSNNLKDQLIEVNRSWKGGNLSEVFKKAEKRFTKAADEEGGKDEGKE